MKLESNEKISITEEDTIINEELSKFTAKTIEAFIRNFPCKNTIIEFRIQGRTYEEYIRTGKCLSDEHDYFYEITIQRESIGEFFERWNKFKKLMVFI